MGSEQSHYQHVSKISQTSKFDDSDDELVICKPRKNRFKMQMEDSENSENESNVMKVKVQVHHSEDKSNDLSLSEEEFEEVVEKRKFKAQRGRPPKCSESEKSIEKRSKSSEKDKPVKEKKQDLSLEKRSKNLKRKSKEFSGKIKLLT